MYIHIRYIVVYTYTIYQQHILLTISNNNFNI